MHNHIIPSKFAELGKLSAVCISPQMFANLVKHFFLCSLNPIWRIILLERPATIALRFQHANTFYRTVTLLSRYRFESLHRGCYRGEFILKSPSWHSYGVQLLIGFCFFVYIRSIEFNSACRISTSCFSTYCNEMSSCRCRRAHLPRVSFIKRCYKAFCKLRLHLSRSASKNS